MKNLIVFISFIAFVACSTPPAEKKYVQVLGIDSTKIPGDNFFMYVNGIWYDSAQIPASQAGVGAYMFMNYPQRLRLQGILDSVASADNPAGSIAQKVGDFYAAGLDTATINQRGYEPIQPLLQSIESINDVSSLMKFVAEQYKVYNTSLMSFGVGPDLKNSKMNIASASQTGLGLPDRDYYFKDDEHNVAIQEAYMNYLATLFELTGTDAETAKANAGIVYGIEKQMAASHKTRVERRDVQGNYNKMAVTELEKRQPNIGWSAFITDLGAQTDSVDVGQPAYYDKLSEMLKSTPITQWKVYLKAHSLSNYADNLSKPFVDATFEFSKVLTGQAVQRERGEIMASAVDRNLGEALGQLYVKKYFPEEAKQRMEVLVDNLQKAFAVRVDNLEWMSDSTKEKAKEKLFAITKKIGYPDHWRDYSNVSIDRDKYFENMVSATAARFQYQLAKLGKPVDKTEWFTTPSTVTA